jgi:hypothetical protein
MGIDQTKELLHSEINSHWIQERAHRMGESLCYLLVSLRSNIQNLQGTQKTQPPKNQHPNEEMGT